MATSNIKSTRLLDSVAATGAGIFYQVAPYRYFVFTCIATSVTTGGTMKVEAQDFENNIVPIATFTVSANGNQAVAINGPFQNERANLTARTDGTYTCRMDAAFAKGT
jgi:hypothetical protein